MHIAVSSVQPSPLHPWFSAWNASNLDAIMACYHDDITHTSPFVARFNTLSPNPKPSDFTLLGKPAVRAYFHRALTSNPTPPGLTRFDPLHITIGVDSLLALYRRWTGEIAGEVFFFSETINNAPAGLIIRSVSHYG
jgi:hypothetical protein